jgi:uncharacterized protein DUF6265
MPASAKQPKRTGRGSSWLVLGLLMLAASSCAGSRELASERPLGIAADLHSDDPDLAACAWLSGDWKGRAGDGALQIYEHWEPPRAGRMLGASHLLGARGSLHREFNEISVQGETLVLEMRHGLADDSPFYRYRLARRDATILVFENDDYEGERAFRIVYERDGVDRMKVRVEHREGDVTRASLFALERSASGR